MTLRVLVGVSLLFIGLVIVSVSLGLLWGAPFGLGVFGGGLVGGGAAVLSDPPWWRR